LHDVISLCLTLPKGTRALVPSLEHDEHGVVYLIHNDLGYLIITWCHSMESGGCEALIDEM
jgi:hypothetical protein